MKNKFDIKYYKRMKRLLTVPFKLVFHPKIIGRENIPESGPYIIICNHKSLLDIPLLITTFDINIHFMAKKELFEHKKFAKKLDRMGAFPVDRDKEFDRNAIKNSFMIIKNKEILGVFPEGTRNKKDGEILPFKEGVAKIATKTGTVILPIGISGRYNFFSRVKLNIGESINMKSISEDKTHYLEEKVKELIR